MKTIKECEWNLIYQEPNFLLEIDKIEYILSGIDATQILDFLTMHLPEDCT